MQLPQFISKAIAFFDKWEANMTATAEKLTTALADVTRLTGELADKVVELATANTQLTEKATEITTLQGKITALETTNAEQVTKIANLEAEKTTVDEAAGKKTTQALAKQGIQAVKVEGAEDPANPGAKNDLLSQYEALLTTDKPAAQKFLAKHEQAILTQSLARDRKPKTR